MFEDDDEEFEERLEQPTPPAAGLTFLDFLAALGISGAVFFGMTLFRFPGLYPEAWGDAVVASGLRPPSSPLPGFWRAIGGLVYQGDVATGNWLLPWIGRAMAATAAGLVYLTLRILLAQITRIRLFKSEDRCLVQRVASFCGALFFACADPVWRAGQTASSPGFLMFLLIVAFFFYMAFMLYGHITLAVPALFIAGAITAESPLGIALLAVCWWAYIRAIRCGITSENDQLLDPAAGQSARWLLSFVWVAGLLSGIGLNCWTFVKSGGLDAIGKTAGDLPHLYITQWWGCFVNAASPLGWILLLSVCLLPCALALFVLPRTSDEDGLLPYHLGTFMLSIGIIAFSQLAMLAPLWFWNWTPFGKVDSQFLLLASMLAVSITVACMVLVFGVEACCRDLSALQMRQFARMGQGGRLVLFISGAVLMVLGVLPGRLQRPTRAALAMINDYAYEVVEESGESRRVFTDGSYDPIIELIAAAQGKKLLAVSLMNDGDEHARSVRLRGDDLDAEDRVAMAEHPAKALLVWIREKPERMKETAIQMGFEFWKQREGKELPLSSGVLSRPAVRDEARRAAGIERTRTLGRRIIAAYDAGLIKPSVVGKRIVELFEFAQWRISRMARMRAERADRTGDAATAEAEAKFAKELEDRNEGLQNLIEKVKKARSVGLNQVTPRESLHMALSRQDFALAAIYAKTILDANDKDPDANFGVAMNFVRQAQWARAEEHLKTCAQQRPRQPTIWNNLGMVCLKMGRLDDAEMYAKKALELIPDSAEVKDTLRQIREAKEAAAKETAEKDKKDGVAPKDEPKPAAKPEPKPVEAKKPPKPEPKPAAKPEPKPAEAKKPPKPEPKHAAKPEPKPAVKPEPKPVEAKKPPKPRSAPKGRPAPKKAPAPKKPQPPKGDA